MMHLKTPHLEAMRRDGLTMTNFHVAAPMCSPARASILVGLFPWRLGVDFIYSQDLKRDGSEEMDHEQLPLLPNIPMAFKDAGYYTAHVGKWHLGGISKAEIAARASLAKNGSTHHPACAAPGINQYGFDEYVAMSEGHDGKVGGVYGSCAQCSMRAVTHEQGNTYSTGARYLVKNDLPLPRRQKDEILTDRQTEEAMRVISEQTALRKPFFLNLWYDAPHSPWEAIEPFFTQFSGKFPATDKPVQLQKYASMIANMDWNIGRLLAHLDELGVGKDTLVLFTSDNGPEIGAGFTGGFKGRKRLLTEGGIRVPCLWRWPNRIVAGSSTDVFAVSTDIFATVLDLVSVSLPAQHRIDGVSLLPVLLGAGRTPAKPLLAGDERVSLFYAHAPDYPKLSAAWAFGLKVVWNDYEGRKAEKLPPPIRVFDMRADGREEVDIYPLLIRSCGAGTSGLDISWTNHTLIDHEELVALAGKGLGLRARRSNNKQTLANTLSSSASVSVALRIVEHLLTRMYLFRHTGEADWRRYHQSKTHVALPSCRTRSMSSAFSTRSPGRGGTEPVERIAFNDAGALLAPAFCAPVSSWNVGCYCSGSSQCASRWTEQGAAWASGALPPPPLSPLAEKHMQSSSRTLGDYLDSTLASSRFRPVCQGHGPAFSPSLVLSPQCGEDAVALWVSHLGMPEPYALCASALTQLTSDGKKDNLSPNALVAGLFEILFGNALSEGATVAASTRQQTLALVLPRAVAGQGEDSWDSYDFSPLAHRLSRGRPNAVTSLIPVCSRGHCNGVLLAVIRGQSARVTVIGDKSTSAAVVLLSKELVGMGITPTIKSHQTSGGTCTLLQVAARIAVDLSPDLSRVRQASCSRIVQAVATWARRESEVMRNERASYLRSMSGTGDDLASLFQAISLSDYMHFSKLPSTATEDVLTCSDTSLAVDRSNLVLKALDLMRAKTGKKAHFKVHLEKIVPMQAGLGGGSGNAATAMYAFNALTSFGASNEDLKSWSGDIGSDITFFFSTGTAYCTGRGEIVAPMPALLEASDLCVHVFKPPEGLSTALVFKALNLENVSKINPLSLLDCFENNGALKAAEDGRLVNDLEPPAFICAPSLLALKKRIEKVPAYKGVMMSGSGTSIYALLPRSESAAAAQLVSAILKEYPQVCFFESDFLNKKDTNTEWFA